MASPCRTYVPRILSSRRRINKKPNSRKDFCHRFSCGGGRGVGRLGHRGGGRGDRVVASVVTPAPRMPSPLARLLLCLARCFARFGEPAFRLCHHVVWQRTHGCHFEVAPEVLDVGG